MADEKHWKGGRLGPFHLGGRYKNVGTDLGRIYAAHDVHTGAPGLVVMPGTGTDWEFSESWRLCASFHAEPAYASLTVEHAPASGQLPDLADMLDLLTSAVERLEKNDEARTLLTGGPVGTWKRWRGRVRRLSRSRRTWAIAGLCAVLVLGVALWQYLSASPGIAVQAAVEAQETTLVDIPHPGAAVIAYPLPAKPLSNQAKAPCHPKQGEVEINGGCWVELAKRPPCYDNQAEYQGKCYLPVSARSHQGEPQALQPQQP
ncbi:hypothetical protein [Archangium sp.]|uniref:hypothetical protein n=1 Tax=Archangium sp. TaxID=1872627 RepID=UPI00286C02A8|nr:hypothetical protein [Archangium sp.]